MDFPFPSPAPEGYFTAQALRAGMIGEFAMGDPAMDRDIIKKRIREEILAREIAEGRMERIREGVLMREMAERRMFEEEMRRERIREEIIAREMEERRIIEEEVRRELELERITGVRRFGEDIFPRPIANHELRMVSDMRLGEGFRVDHVARLPRGGTDQKMLLPVTHKVRDGKNPHSSHGIPDERSIKLPSEMENKASKVKLSGVKRKAVAGSGARGLPSQVLGCALCEVTATSKEALDEHLQGKRHRVKALQLAGSKTVIIRNGSSASTPKEATGISGGKPASGTEKVRSTGTRKQPLRENLTCKLCNVRCNSKTMLACHVRGKKHNARLESQKKRDSLVEAKEHNEAQPDTRELRTDTELNGAEGMKHEKKEEVKQEKNEEVMEANGQTTE